jgi:hypothetical protein
MGRLRDSVGGTRREIKKEGGNQPSFFDSEPQMQAELHLPRSVGLTGEGAPVSGVTQLLERIGEYDVV